MSVRSYGQAGSQMQEALHSLVPIVNPTSTLHLVTRLRILGYLISSPQTSPQWDAERQEQLHLHFIALIL
jgi:hypothetical protein